MPGLLTQWGGVFQAHCSTIAGLTMAEGRVYEKRNRIPLALFNSNLKGTFHLLCAVGGAQWSAQCLVLILHCVAGRTGRIHLFCLRWGSRSLPVSISENGVDLSSTWLWAVLIVPLTPSICHTSTSLLPYRESRLFFYLNSSAVRNDVVWSSREQVQPAARFWLESDVCVQVLFGYPNNKIHCIRLSIKQFQVNWAGILFMYFKRTVCFLFLFCAHLWPNWWNIVLENAKHNSALAVFLPLKCISFLFGDKKKNLFKNKTMLRENKSGGTKRNWQRGQGSNTEGFVGYWIW